MKYLPLILISVFICSCASYKVEPSPNFDFTKLNGADSNAIGLEKTNEHAQGGQCFEPMLFVLTIGIIPTHCVDDYKVTIQGENIGSAKVTTMSGWIPLFMAIMPKWKYGIEPKVEHELKKQHVNR